MPYAISSFPKDYESILKEYRKLNFTMISDEEVGVLLRLLTSSKKEGEILELLTGTRLTLVWIVDGLHSKGKVISIENNSQYIEVARSFFDKESRINIVQEDAKVWIKKTNTFNLI